MLNTDDIRYSFWLEKELKKNVKRLAGNVSRGCKSCHDAYKVRATQDAIRRLNGEKEANGAIEKVQDMLYAELMSGQIRPALYTSIVKVFEGVK
jgi:hypothetical protein